MSNSTFRRHRPREVRVLGAVVATVCVVGLAGALWVHADSAPVPLVQATRLAPAPADDAFLHAPATAIAVRSADQVFGYGRGASTDDAPVAPTF